MGKQKNVIELKLLAWEGYKKLEEQYQKELEEKLNIRLTIEPRDNPDIIYREFVANQGAYDIVIVDYEYRLLYEGFISELKDDIIKENQYIKPFCKEYYYCIGNKKCLVPIRFGTNGFVYRIKETSEYNRDHFEVSLSNTLKEMASSGEEIQKMALWNWWLPNMMLLAKAAGINALENITENQLNGLEKNGILRKFIECFQNQKKLFQRRPTEFKKLSNIIEYEIHSRGNEANNIDWILGPSEMVVAPICSFQRKKGVKESFNWDIPKEGGLIWLESAAIWKDIQSKDKLNAALELLKFLQSEEVQLFLICGAKNLSEIKIPTGHWSYAMNNKDGVERVPPEIKKPFHNKFLERSAGEFSNWISHHLDCGGLTLRALPVDSRMRYLWKECWKRVVTQCLA